MKRNLLAVHLLILAMVTACGKKAVTSEAGDTPVITLTDASIP